MTGVIAICVSVTFGVSIFLLLSRELKGVAMGVFLLGHTANLSVLAMSRPPVRTDLTSDQVEQGVIDMKVPPILQDHEPMLDPLASMVDPLPQALILTAIVIGFGVMGFLLSLIVVTGRETGTLEPDELAVDDRVAVGELL